ncbi:increased DNA methylation 1-like [Chenopodium quinoa]|uniref:PHD-type domain-containing protein n=1 Tax=Chenopodium quinoa TaxID=63459 RepID=A0A803L4J6_CHEQI|nr:increased DNA methylation 1-like [Chenopodium quinoa]
MGEDRLYVLALPSYEHVENRKSTRNTELKSNLSVSHEEKVAREPSNDHIDDTCSGVSDLIGVHDEIASNSMENNNRSNTNDLSGDNKVNSGEITSESSANSCTEGGGCTSEITRNIYEHASITGGLKIRFKIKKNSEECRSNTSASEARVFLNGTHDGISWTNLSLADKHDVDELRGIERGALPAERVGKGANQDTTSCITGSKRKRVTLPIERVGKRANQDTTSRVTGSKSKREGGGGKRNDSLHKVLFMPYGLADGAYLSYRVKGLIMLEGYKQGNGIFCSHCSSVISPSQFEAHAGMAIRKKPYQHIYDVNGITLHDLAVSLAEGQDQTNWKNNDDSRLIRADNSEVDYVDPLSKPKKPPVIKLQRRTVKKSEMDYSSNCSLCSKHDYSVNTFDDRTVIICDQCEKEYHVGCLRGNGRCDLKEIPKDKWFCCHDCDRISVALRECVARGSQVIPFSETSKINRDVVKKQSHEGADTEVRWRIVGGKSCPPEHQPLLSKAVYLIRDCFSPITTPNGRDLITLMVHGRNISGQDFGGMYCVFLTVKSTVISVGLLRILGNEIAELPIVATRKKCQGKGYFLALYSRIEELLSSLKVKKLVLPAADHAKHMWINRLGFSDMSEENLATYTKMYQLTQFNGTVMLEKQLEQQIDCLEPFSDAMSHYNFQLEHIQPSMTDSSK